MKFIRLVIISIILEKIYSNEEINCPNLKCQSSGICVDNYNQCPTPMSCGEDFKKVNQFTCSKSDFLKDEKECPNFTCWTNECINDINQCPSMISCPSKTPVRCHDNSCVDKTINCPKYINCPKFIPIRCPNGDCRRNPEDCPSLTKCPKEFSIICNDGSCKMTAEECEKPSDNTRCSGTMVRCSDGSCKTSKFLCPTPRTCPVGMVLCWDGNCSNNFKECKKPVGSQINSCADVNKIKCEYDSSCRNIIYDCPTAMICPVEKPVKCWDNSCKENIFNCPQFEKCPDKFIECPNGSCKFKSNGNQDAQCGTLITCSWDAPFKCNDNTCRRNPKDCIKQENCSSLKPILCWDGTCVANRLECLSPGECPSNTSVRCPDNQCRKSVEECREITGCPVGYIRCEDRTCKRKSSDCKDIECPINFNKRCFNGVCVSELENCDNNNGCPFYSQIKCKNGKCSESIEDCEEQEIIFDKDLNQLCLDGSIIPKGLSCPLDNGCPASKPILCGNNECRNSCKIATCPKETPIKCMNGLCVMSKSDCPSYFDFKTDSKCNEKNMILCANGLCAKFPEECKPTAKCPNNMFICKDGTCRSSLDFCPGVDTCPKMHIRCPNGACAEKIQNCLNLSGCPMKRPLKCINNGLCVINQDECTVYDKKFPMANGCELEKPFKCSNGKCVIDKENCDEKYCPTNEILCPNSGICVKKMNYCKNSENKKCGKFSCPTNGVCVDKIDDCKTISGCDWKTPYRCLDGQCRALRFNFDSNSESQFCSLRIECPNYKPYLCADGSCQEKTSFCKPLNECPEDKRIRCSDRKCVNKYEDCDKYNISCPAKNPILCLTNGNCVENIFDCFEEKCPELNPIKCVTGLCVSSPRDCLPKKFDITSNTTLINLNPCDNNSNLCYDGSCEKDISDCPIFDGCNNLKFPYKCINGKCSKDLEECYKDNLGNQIAVSLIDIKCEEKQTLCEDGICRKICPLSNSCNNIFPYLCSNGICVKNINECAGESKCELETPFRCMDGNCKSDPSSCKKPKKLEISTDIKLYAFPEIDLNMNIIFDDLNDIIGFISIPSNSFVKYNKTDNATQIPIKQIISIKSISSKNPIFSKSFKKFPEKSQDVINKLFPYGDKDDKFELEFDYSVISPIVKVDFSIKDNVNITKEIILKLAYDFQTNNLNKTNSKSLDKVCLSCLDELTSEWICVRKLEISENKINENYYEGPINKTGIYAITLNITIIDDEKKDELKWIYKFLFMFLGLVLGGVIFLGLLIFIFGRICRYRKKYLKTKIDFIEMEKKEANMKEKSTNFKGETIKDTEQNMVFTDNPCKILKIDDKNEKSEIRLQELRSIGDSLFYKFKILESNNEKLLKEYDSMNDRVDKLKEYVSLIRDGKSLISEDE